MITYSQNLIQCASIHTGSQFIRDYILTPHPEITNPVRWTHLSKNMAFERQHGSDAILSENFYVGLRIR